MYKYKHMTALIRLGWVKSYSAAMDMGFDKSDISAERL